MSISPVPLLRCEHAIDVSNEFDPGRTLFEGEAHPTAQIEGRRAAAWVRELVPGASDVLLLAARAHHLRRWEVSRDSYPRTREGYHAWRGGLYDFHAHELAKLMLAAGYTEGDTDHASRILHKRGIKSDAEVQAHEDAVSLAFVELRLVSFAPTVNDEQLMRALKRTLLKMSPGGRAALESLRLDDDTSAVLAKLEEA